MNLYPWLQNVGSFLLLLGAFGRMVLPLGRRPKRLR